MKTILNKLLGARAILIRNSKNLDMMELGLLRTRWSSFPYETYFIKRKPGTTTHPATLISEIKDIYESAGFTWHVVMSADIDRYIEQEAD